MNQVEVWKDIPGFEGLYQASNQGRIRSLDMRVRYKNPQFTALRKGRILSPKTTNRGYLEVVLMKNGVRHNKRVHQLVALTFIPNPNNYTSINHINEVKNDNAVENLEWCTQKYNNDAYYCQRVNIYQYNLQGDLIKIWHSITNAAKEIGGDKTGIQHCCGGSLKTFMGYIWTYCPLSSSEFKRRTTNETLVEVLQLDLSGNIIATHKSTVDAAKAVGCNPSAITMACNGMRKTIKGYIWKRKV